MQQKRTRQPRSSRPLFLAEWMDFADKSNADLIEATGADKSLVSRWLKQGVEPGPEYQDALAGLFETTWTALYSKPPKKLTYTNADPAAPDPIDPDAHPTIGSETGAQGIPVDASPQLDVTAGMGAGGLTVLSEGIAGRAGMTFSAENVSDYWRLPRAILSSIGSVKPADITFVPVQGDSMSPTLIEGDVVVVDTRHRSPSPDGIYALLDSFGGIVVKRLEVVGRPSDEEQMVDVISDNEVRHPRKRWRVDDVRVVGRVVRRFGIVQ